MMQSKELAMLCSLKLAMVLYIGNCDSATINDTNVLLEDILNGYNKNVRPVANQADAVNVSTILVIKSIQELDEIRGIFSIFAAISMSWHDARMTWDPQKYGGIEYVLTSYKEVWLPELILISPAEDTDTLGKKWQRVTFHYSGSASWWPGDLIKSTCSLNMQKYPFDTQICIVSFNAWGYSSDQVKIRTGIDHVDMRYYIGNSAWTIAKTKADVVYEGNQVDFHFFLERKPGFVMVNVVLPLTFLSLLNVFVFLLIPESGERISYCITVLLSIAVFMTIVSDTLPRSSEPVPAISYKLLFDMLTSSLMTITTILNLRLYNKDDRSNVPNWLQSIYMFLSCSRFKIKVHPSGNEVVRIRHGKGKQTAEKVKLSLTRNGSKQKAHPSTTNVGELPGARKPSITVIDYEEIPNEKMEKKLMRMISTTVEEGKEIEISWKQISYMVDGIALVGFTLMSVGSLVVFMCITYNN